MNDWRERNTHRFDRQVMFRRPIGRRVRRALLHAATVRLQHDIAGIRLVSIRLVNPIKTLQLSKSD